MRVVGREMRDGKTCVRPKRRWRVFEGVVAIGMLTAEGCWRVMSEWRMEEREREEEDVLLGAKDALMFER